ncbi:hypothetical protein [Rothia amarae]|uniref:hypothetical protein n=1 Tax=Rothia amarae TaxID=169480 RepID=UPI0031D8B011
MRIYDPYAKCGVILAGWFTGGLILNMLLSTLFPDGSEDISEFIYVTVVAVCIYGLTRIFRAEGETPAPRPWWQMTGRPTAAFILALYFLAGFLVPAAVFIGLLLTGSLLNSLLSNFNGWNLAKAVIYIALGTLYYFTWWKLRKNNPRVETHS